MRTRISVGLAGIMLVGGLAGVQAADVDQLLNEGSSWLVAQRESQKRIDKIDSDVADADAEYQRLLRQVEGLEAYNRQLKTQINAQEKEIAVTDASISKATEVDRQLLPLMNNMVETYEKLVDVSLPFLPDEREQRAKFLRETIDRADVPASEKFRQVLDAYMTELSYGNTIEAYNDTIKVDGAEIEVAVLRLGRIGLYYQSPDRTHTGRWNPEAGSWESLGSNYRNEIYQAIRVANKLTAPNLLTVPLPAPVDAGSASASNLSTQVALTGAGQ